MDACSHCYILPWACVAYGAALTVTGSALFAPVRGWAARRLPLLGRLLSCPMCVGWWAGVALHAAGLGLFEGAGASGWAADGFASLAVCWGAHVVLARLGAEAL